MKLLFSDWSAKLVQSSHSILSATASLGEYARHEVASWQRLLRAVQNKPGSTGLDKRVLPAVASLLRAMLIPKPKISGVRDIEGVLLAETHSLDDVRRFKSVVRIAARTHLDLSISYARQDVEKRRQFRQQVMQHDVKMCQYSFQWPIDNYVRLWESCRRKRMARKKDALSRAGICQHNPSTVVNASKKAQEKASIVTTTKARVQERWTISFVGKPPPRTSVVSAAGSLPPKKASQPKPSSNQTKPLKGTAPSHVEALNAETRQPRKCETDTVKTTPRAQYEDHYPSPCSFCGYLCQIPVAIRVKLFELFSEIPHVVPTLATSGLVHDHHLAILLTWDKRDRQEFCDRLPRNCYSVLDRAILTKLLINHSTLRLNDPEKCHRSNGEGSLTVNEFDASSQRIKWLNDGKKALLVDPEQPLSLLKQAMGIGEDGGLFLRMIDLADQHGEGFLKDYECCAQESAKRLKEAIGLVTMAEPRLLCYENAWPVQIYLQREVNRRLRRPSGQIRSLSSSARNSNGNNTVSCTSSLNASDNKDAALPAGANGNETKTSSEHTSVAPSVATESGRCPVHLPPDLSHVSQSIKNFFSSRGMQELVTPLASFGVTTEKQFALFCSLSDEQRDSIVAQFSLSKPTLNLFQSMTLKVLLRNR